MTNIPKPPNWKVLQRLGYLRPKSEYMAMSKDQCKAMLRFDGKQARRDWQYDKLRSPLSDKHTVNGVECTDKAYIDTLSVDQLHKCIANLLLQGYIATDIADMLGVTDCMVSRYKQVIAKAIQSNSDTVHRLSGKRTNREATV